MYSVLIGTLLLSGCAIFEPKPPTTVEKLIYVTVPLTLPERPTLPTFGAKDITCISPEIKQKLLDRDRLRSEYAKELETIILSTTKK
jgi:PBP1b-binding outer membrane lipoprotein LpoB